VSEQRNPFTRWSQRKAAARRGEAVAEATEDAATSMRPDDERPSSAPDQDVPAGALGAETKADAAAAAESDMPVLPSIDELDFHSDYTVFLAKNVPESLRRAALRKLWRSDPVLANLDGLNDYDEDYHLVDTTITAAQTAYKAGLGYLDEIENKLAQVDETLASAARAESQIDSEREQAGGDGTLSNSDAGGDDSPDARRPPVAGEPDVASIETPEERGK
jgi:Protein of unknown function (DUF3306)